MIIPNIWKKKISKPPTRNGFKLHYFDLWWSWMIFACFRVHSVAQFLPRCTHNDMIRIQFFVSRWLSTPISHTSFTTARISLNGNPASNGGFPKIVLTLNHPFQWDSPCFNHLFGGYFSISMYGTPQWEKQKPFSEHLWNSSQARPSEANDQW